MYGLKGGDAHCLVYDDESFDAVVASNILHLLPDPGMAMNEIVRVMKKDGLLVLPTYCHGENRTSRMLSRVMGFTGFRAVSKWSIAEYGEFVTSFGLEIVREDHLGGSIPISCLSARKKK
jgi:phosphatidylethanolamine/phosphatidyl-N-methylethanolamine N-methyltransferase